MGVIADVLSWIALAAGGFFYVVGAVGLNRFPDVFTRMHAASVSDTLGVGLLVLGMLLQAGFTLIAVKLIFIALALWTAGAVATHALARAALHDGAQPLLADETGKLVETDCGAIFPGLAARLATPLVSEAVEEAPAEVPMGPEGPVDATTDQAPEDRRRGTGSGGGT